MRHLTKTSIVSIGLAALLVLPASAAPPTVGGPRKASMPISFTATGPQQHVLAETIDNPVDKEVAETCAPPRCHAFPFTAAPLKKGDRSIEVSARVTWTSPTSRFWLNLVDVTKPSEPVITTQCFTWYVAAGTSSSLQARVSVSRKWAVWVTVQQMLTPSEVVTGAVQSPPKNGPAPHTLDAAPTEAKFFLNPCQT